METLQSLQQEAEAYFIRGDFKKALELYKLCWKQAVNDQNRGALRDCYLGRAHQLAAKRMPREALVMWENHRLYCSDCRLGAFYIHNLLAAGLRAKAVIAFQDPSLTLSAAEVTSVEEIFAALLLSDPEVQKALTHSNSALNQQAQIARQILDIFCQNDLTEAQRTQMEALLKQIPFRSPYRYFRQVVQACLSLPEDRFTALSQLQAIPNTSVFFRLAWVSQLALAEEFKLAAHLPHLTSAEWNWLSGLRGLTLDRQKLLDRIRKLESKSSPASLLGLILRHITCFEPLAAVKHACYRLLPWAMGEQTTFEKVLGPLQSMEKKHLQTLALLHKPKQDRCPHCVWLALEKSLSSLSSQEGQISLKRALILRHAATHVGEPKNIPELESSLKWDPSDKPTYLTLIHYYQRIQESQRSQAWLQKAIQQFPNDPELLRMGIHIAHEQGKEQQAIQYCRSLLTLDPLNAVARQYLARVDISKMQNALRRQQFDTARQQFTQLQHIHATADPLTRSWIYYSQILFEYLSSNKTAAESLLQKNCPHVQENAIERVAFYLEALSFGIAPPSLEQDLSLKPLNLLTFESSTLASLFETLHRYPHKNAVKQVYSLMDKPLMRALAQSITLSDFEQLNESMRRAKQFTIMKNFIKAQAPRFDHLPIFYYYKLLAKVKGIAAKLNDTECERLEHSAQKALQGGDTRTAHKIDGFLAAYYDAEDEEANFPPEFEERMRRSF